LESVLGATPQEFESPILRQPLTRQYTVLHVTGRDPVEVTAADVFDFLAHQRGDRRVVRLADRESGLSARMIARRYAGRSITKPTPRKLAAELVEIMWRIRYQCWWTGCGGSAVQLP
jgi:hypothetical protein